MSSHYSKKLIFTLLACAPLGVRADVVSVENAKQLAAEFFGACGQEKLASEDALELAYTSGTQSHPLYYVFNGRSGEGYVIVSADDCTSTPVLGYSPDGRYDAASLPPAMKWMMQGLESEIKAAPGLQKPVGREERRRLARRAATGSGRILLPTPEWRQEYPFNSMIPGNPLAGCVGTAMAMIMKYHNYPERGTGSYNGVSFDVAYDWDNMRMDNYRYGYSQAEADAVGTLVWHAAASVGTQFGFSGSSAYEVKVPAALVNYFGYDPGVSYRKRSETATQAEFDKLVENDIKAGRPVLYCGQDVTAGHAFVVDGYDPLSGMIHVNWGWGGADGNNNGGWYASTALNPTVSQQHSFNNMTTVLYNIRPGSGDNAKWSRIHITGDGRQAGMSSDLEGDLAPGQPFTVRVGNLKNVSYEDFKGKITVGLFGADGSFRAALSKTDGFSLKGMEIFYLSYADFSCQLPGDVEVADGDVIRMATSTDDGATWLPVPGELVTCNEIPAKGARPQLFTVSHSSVAGASFSGEPSVIRGWNYRFSVVPADEQNSVITVKANGYVLTAGANHTYTVNNVLSDLQIDIFVQDASEVREKRSLWVGEAGTLSQLLDGGEAATVKELTLYGTIDARDFAYIKSGMKLRRLDLSAASIAAYGSDQANAVPREAFRGLWNLQEVILPASVTRLNNGAFRSCGIRSIVIPARVSTIEYNVFNGSDGLTDIWVGNATPAYINWCVLHGTPVGRMTLHCPSEASVEKYRAKEYWADIANIVAEQIPQATDYAFAVMEDAEVKYNADTEPGRYAAGKKVIFTAEHIADNDNRMDVYANSTLLKPDAEGNYATVIDRNTIIHFDLVKPMAVSTYQSPWTITDDGGTVGLLTDAVNVLPGVPFTIRVNSFSVSDNAFWAAVLTTATGEIKEFISPVANWSAGAGKGLKMNVNCCVNDATVREGNMIRLATSYNKKTWVLVEGSNENVVSALPALNNQTPVYNFTFPADLEEKATLSGIVASAVRGRDLTFKITPRSAGDVITMLVNGQPYAQNAKSVSYSFIAKEDLDFDVKVTTPNLVEEVVFDLKSGERLWDNSNTTLRRERLNALKPKVVVKGDIDYTDLGLFRHITAQGKVVSLDLSGARIVADRSNPTSYKADEFPSFAFCASNSVGTVNIALKELRFPPAIKMIQANALYNCSRITELELPLNLYNNAVVDGVSHVGGLKQDCFKGCDALTTIYCYATPAGGNVDMVHHIDFNGPYGGSWNNPAYFPNTLGLTNPSKVSVVVKPEYWTQYSTPKNTGSGGWINGWKQNNFNMVYDYPVYGVNYDVTRCFVNDKNLDIKRVASFLGDDCVLGSQDFSGTLFVAALSRETSNRPAGADAYGAARQVKVYDNGKLLPASRIASDGSLTLTFYNPNNISRQALCGDHEVEVVYLYDVKFRTPGADMVIVPAEIRNDEAAGDAATSFETFNYYDAKAPVLESVREHSTVRFRIRLDNVKASELKPVVRIGENVVTADEDGYYSVDVEESDLTVDVYAVPVEGATLNPEEVAIINAAEARDLTSVALAGDIAPEKLKELVDQFPAIERLDLSGLTKALPEGAMEGKETLVTVALPAATDIEAGTFRGCTNLTSVHVPECVDYIGESAFEGCASLRTLTFTGIRGVGADAFSGCGRLTSVLLTGARPDTEPARIRRRVATARTEGFSADAFRGMNPNCIVYLDENVDVPSAKANYVRVRQDASVDGGRIYEAVGSIQLDPACDFEALNSFHITDGNTVSLEMPLNVTSGSEGWSTLVLPFAADAVTYADGSELKPFTGGAAVTGAAGVYVAATLSAARSGELALTGGIEANTPYVVAVQKGSDAGVVRFTGVGSEVPQTPSEIKVSGVAGTLAATFTGRALPASTTGLLDSNGSAFVTADDASDDAVAEVAPFSVYTTGEPGSRLDINLATDPDITTGADQSLAAEDGYQVAVEGSLLVITAPEAADVEIYDLSGRLVRSVSLSEGRNSIGTLSPGAYFLLGRKVIL
ncbi:MAG: C10 family peptidase [Muribaculaceae bacterium]|nr:C10 family peptidase [Muribaculaceae bacterium]